MSVCQGVLLIVLTFHASLPGMLLLAAGETPGNSWINAEKKLFHDLTINYSKSVRPVDNHEDSLPVKFTFALISLEDLVEETQTLVVNGWIKMQWTDTQLQWNSAEYENIKGTRIPIEKIWNPDVTLYNHFEDNMFSSSYELPVVYSTGLVFWVPRVRFQIKCTLDLYNFPYDEHLCQLVFGSWTHHENEINLTMFDNKYEADFEEDFFAEHPEWKITRATKIRNSRQYKCCKEKFIDITYNLTLARRDTYHTHLFVAPSVILALLIPFVFLLPPEGNEKCIFGFGLMIGNILLLEQMQVYIPVAHHTVPRIGMYYLTNIVLIGFALAISAIVTNIWHRSTRKTSMPACLRGVIGILSRLFCVNRDDYMPVDSSDQNVRRLEMLSSTDPGDTATFNEDRQKFMRSFARMTASSEWRQFATVLDRLFFFVFTIVVVLTTVSVVR